MTTLPIPDEALNSHIGILGKTPTSDPLAIDVDRLIGSHACIVANSGGGKSGLIRRLLEVTHGRVQHIVLDGEDEFYTLRERYDYVIAGGEGGDVPAPVASAEGLAIGALTHGFSLIVQLNDLGFDGAPDFIGRFLTAMVTAPRHLWHPVLVVVDEAQRFVPRQGTTAASAGVRALIAQGRKRGFTAVLAGTKFTEIDPAARGGVNNWMLGRVGQAVDRNTMADQLGFTAKEGRERLGRMGPRSFWAFGPALAQEPVLFHVADVETTPIHAGQAKVPTPPAPEALRAILQGLAVEPVPEPIDKLPESERAHAAAPAWPDQRAEVAALQEENARLRDEMGKCATAMDSLTAVAREAQRRIIGARAALEGRAAAAPGPTDTAIDQTPAPQREDPAPPPRREEPRKPEAPTPVPPRARQAQGLADGETSPSPAALAIAGLLDRINPARVTWSQAAAMVGRKAHGGSFNTARKWLRASGRIVEDGDLIRSAAEAPAGMTRAEALDLWKSVLTAPAPRMIDALEKSPLHPDELAEAIGAQPRGGSWNTGLAQLRRNGVAEVRGGEWHLARPLPGEAL